MFEYIDKLRKKNEKTRKTIAFSVAFVVAISLFIIWLTVFLPDFENEQQAQKALAESKSPATNFMDVLSDGIVKIQNSITQAKRTINELSATSTYYRSSNSELSAVPERGN